jgi:CheY-like chemotaxis protein
MPKRVLDVGNCVPDFTTLTGYLTSHFDCEVLHADDGDAAMAALSRGNVDLIVVNRELDCDGSPGADIIRRLKADPATAAIPVMLITNFADHQDAAVALGAVRGFGKKEYGKPETLQRLTSVLG